MSVESPQTDEREALKRRIAYTHDRIEVLERILERKEAECASLRRRLKTHIDRRRELLVEAEAMKQRGNAQEG